MNKDQAFRTVVCFVALITAAVALLAIVVLADKQNRERQTQETRAFILQGDTILINGNLEIINKPK